ncbi:hypothetical protein BASA60_000001 [Batrachochytrium salamandrivorans]|nr:hypothetical protein BASA60_000001 [Batrachochytrium salamandrivorans]
MQHLLPPRHARLHGCQCRPMASVEEVLDSVVNQDSVAQNITTVDLRNEHCGMGCQPDVASCNPPSPLTGLKVSPDGTCGRGTNHKCGKGQCCSQYNRCGTGEEYCGDDCQNFFGTCDPPSDLRKVPVTTDARCGKEVNARCEGVECCSDDGYCGSDKDYCDAGCQPGYGLCNPLSRPQGLTVSPHGKCGRGSKFGCRPGFCCSRYNYCGLGEEYCDVGCQPLFGTCNPTSPAKSSSTKSGSGKRKHDGSSKPRSKKRRPGQHTDRKVKKDRSRSDKHVCLLLFFWYLVTTLHRIQSGLVPAIQKSRLRLLGRALDPGVENVYTWLRGKYLGVLIDSKLDHSAWLKQKRSALEHTISALHPVLANHQLTVNYRSRIFSAVVMGKAYYGLELVGGNKSHLAPLQTTINKGIRLFTGARLSTAIGPLLVETGIGSLLTRSLVSRVRLLERSVTKRTPINAICSGTDNDVFTLNVQGQLVRSQRWFWSRRTKQLYRNRYWLTPQIRPKTVKQRHSFALMETLRTCGDSASLQKYVTRQLLDTSGFFKDPSFDQSRAHGTRYLMLARMDALWTARKAIRIGILVDTHPFSADHCILCDQQLLSTSIAHLVVECEQVTGHRIQSGLVPAIQKSRLRLLGRALDPGVENVYTWLRGGVLNGEADLDQQWLDGTVEHESMGTRHDNRALAARLADFLQVAYRQYQSTLWKYHRDRLVEVG